MSNTRATGKITVIGAANVDIGGVPFEKFVPGDSNPGKVHISHGGVGRNIAHNLALLGCDVAFVTAMGDDIFAKAITDELSALSVDISHAEILKGHGTSTYCYICDSDGDMISAVSDMEICALLTPQFLSSRLELFNASSLIVADANMPAETLLWLTSHTDTPLLIEPVSAVKAKRLPPSLEGVYAIKPNRIEAEVISGVRIHSIYDCRAAADAILAKGVQRVFITLGPDGVWCADSEQHIRIENIAPRLKGATGAGDAFTAALARSFLDGASLRDSALCGLASSAIACEYPDAVNPEMSFERVCKMMKNYQ